MNAEIGNLLNDLQMLFESQECYSKEYFTSESARINAEIDKIKVALNR
jgi:hypothetical protein